MVISHKHKYIFAELPRTGSSAISDQLVKLYDGEKILIKHATYRNFLKFYKNKYEDYFVFSCLRSPLDKAVSSYQKLKNGRYAGTTFPFLDWYYKKTRLNFVQKSDSFEDYFLKFYKIPYDDWASLDHKNFDFIIRFETLQEDFSKVLEILKIKQVQKIPVINKTEKTKTYKDYYTKPTQKKAVQIFGIYCEKFGYDFPFESNSRVSGLTKLVYNTLLPIRKLIWVLSKNNIIKNKIKKGTISIQ